MITDERTTMVAQEPLRTGRIFAPNSPKPPKYIQAVRDTHTGETYHRDSFDCWLRTGDVAAFLWETLNHHDPDGRWVGVELQEIPEFTSTEALFQDMRSHFQALHEDLVQAQEIRLQPGLSLPIARLAEAQRVLRLAAKDLGVPDVA